MCIWRWRCGAGRAWRSCASDCCRRARSASPGRRWRPCWWRRGCASRRASCTLPRIGIGARRCAICCSLSDEQVNKDRLYRALDHLLVHKAALEAHLSQRCGELFAVQNEVLLYDVTSTYFEGQARGQSAGAARLLARSSARLQAGLHRAGGDLRRLSLWATRCSPATPTTRAPCRPSSPPWRPGTACWAACGSPTAAWPAPTIWRGCARPADATSSARRSRS